MHAAPPDARIAPSGGPTAAEAAEPGVGPRTDPARDRLDSLMARALARAVERSATDLLEHGGLGVKCHVRPDVPLRSPALEAVCGAVAPAWQEVAAASAGWRWLRDAHRLRDDELDVVLVALAPELDLRYERLLARVQDDDARRRPTVELAADLVTADPGDRPAALSLLRADGPLVASRIVRLVPDPRWAASPLLAREVVPDSQVVDLLTGRSGLDSTLAGTCTLTWPQAGAAGRIPLPAGGRDALRAAAVASGPDDGSVRPVPRLHLHGPRGSGRRTTAAALAGEAGAPLLELDAERVPQQHDEAEAFLGRVGREAVLQGAWLHVTGLDALPEDGAVRAALGRLLADHPGAVSTAGLRGWTPLPGSAVGVLEVSFEDPGADVRRRVWATCLDEAGVAATVEDVDALASRFRAPPGQVAGAVASAVAAAVRRGPGRGPTREDLFAAARRQTGQWLAELTRRVQPVRTWDDLVLPPDGTAQLREICARVALREQVWEGWGFARRTSSGRGVTALFTGPPGTGKTTAAEVVASELGLDLFTVDLSTVVSKYIGETEKNLERVFAAATDTDAVLLFDEADALFGKRSQVRDAHDRYANVETAYLLQRMERYDGIAVLATNLREHLDEAFTRRLQFVVDFPFPEEAQRRRLWRTCLPAQVPLADDVDLDGLGRDYRLSGAAIQSAALHAAFRAAARGGAVSAADLLAAVRREHVKLGRVTPDVAGVPGPADDGVVSAGEA